MKSKATPGTPFGPVEIDVLSCDLLGCGAQAQEAYAVGWVLVARLGSNMFGHTMDGLPDDESHWCSIGHLKEFLCAS